MLILTATKHSRFPSLCNSDLVQKQMVGLISNKLFSGFHPGEISEESIRQINRECLLQLILCNVVTNIRKLVLRNIELPSAVFRQNGGYSKTLKFFASHKKTFESISIKTLYRCSSEGFLSSIKIQSVLLWLNDFSSRNCLKILGQKTSWMYFVWNGK